MIDVRDLEVGLDSEAGLVRAIDGLRMSIARGETFALVLAANLFADGVREAFDPRARLFRPRRPLAARPPGAAR